MEENFPEEARLVTDARALLSSPTPEQSSRFTGLGADLDEFFAWIGAGKPADGVRKFQTSQLMGFQYGIVMNSSNLELNQIILLKFSSSHE